MSVHLVVVHCMCACVMYSFYRTQWKMAAWDCTTVGILLSMWTSHQNCKWYDWSHPWCERWLVWPSHHIFISVYTFQLYDMDTVYVHTLTIMHTLHTKCFTVHPSIQRYTLHILQAVHVLLCIILYNTTLLTLYTNCFTVYSAIQHYIAHVYCCICMHASYVY